MNVDVFIFFGAFLILLLWPFCILFWRVQNWAGDGEYLHEVLVTVGTRHGVSTSTSDSQKEVEQSRISGLNLHLTFEMYVSISMFAQEIGDRVVYFPTRCS